MLSTYVKAWCMFHLFTVPWQLFVLGSVFYAGADDVDPSTCFVGNNLICSESVCKHTEIICQASTDIHG